MARKKVKSSDNEDWKNWAQDFYSGYMYDPDCKFLDKDISKSPKQFLKGLDEAIKWMPYMTETEKEKMVSRLIQWKKRICEEADWRLLIIQCKLEEESEDNTGFNPLY